MDETSLLNVRFVTYRPGKYNSSYADEITGTGANVPKRGVS
jgi:hypothetical protein